VYIGVGHFVSEYQMSGSSEGKRFTCDGVDVIAVADGRIARKDTYLDWTAIQLQLGAELTASLTA
jgi:ketosteroid isomerase-like protein